MAWSIVEDIVASIVPDDQIHHIPTFDEEELDKEIMDDEYDFTWGSESEFLE